jgi:hypothetical protein
MPMGLERLEGDKILIEHSRYSYWRRSMDIQMRVTGLERAVSMDGAVDGRMQRLFSFTSGY